jgi:hypothetical protein
MAMVRLFDSLLEAKSDATESGWCHARMMAGPSDVVNRCEGTVTQSSVDGPGRPAEWPIRSDS